MALGLSPDLIPANYNKGAVLHTLGELSAALESYDRVLSLDSLHQSAHWNKALLLLLQGDYAEGWRLYEWRLKAKEAKTKYPTFPQPSWRGEEDISDKRLLIHSEQGLGDVVQFGRFAPLLLARCAEVILEVPKPLVSVMQTLHPEVSIAVKGEALPHFDCHCPVMSLPFVLKTTLETVPSSSGYLRSSAEKVQRWADKLGVSRDKRIGVVWSGSATHKNDHNRSIPLLELSPLFDLPYEWHSLQKEYREGDLDLLSELPHVHQHQDSLSDFSDTAALIECLDLVITVDTSVAHIAGALGKPVWILLPYVPDFRWLLDREDSPWYDSARLFRQSDTSDFSEVIENVKSFLQKGSAANV